MFLVRAVLSALHGAQGLLRGFTKVTQDLGQLQHVRELERAAKHVNELIAITGWGQEADKARSQEAGFDVHLTKLVDESALIEILEANGYSNGTANH